ncbi:hypothetical protein [Acinetobacter sp.]|uniref:hypothetical protein n=1 Tax=Acinetobacter sp. TaxID=472 RepID=UPI00388D2330
MNDPKNTVTIGKRDDSKSWKILQANYAELWDKKEIGYIGLPSRKTYVFKDRDVLEQFVEKLNAKKIVHSIDCIYPEPDLW